MHRIYLAATMGYGLGSDDPEELAYYKKLRKEMDDMKNDAVKKGIPLKWDNSGEKDWWILAFLLIDGSLILIGLPLMMLLKGKKKAPQVNYLTAKVTPITAVISFFIVEVS